MSGIRSLFCCAGGSEQTPPEKPLPNDDAPQEAETREPEREVMSLPTIPVAVDEQEQEMISPVSPVSSVSQTFAMSPVSPGLAPPSPSLLPPPSSHSKVSLEAPPSIAEPELDDTEQDWARAVLAAATMDEGEKPAPARPVAVIEPSAPTEALTNPGEELKKGEPKEEEPRKEELEKPELEKQVEVVAEKKQSVEDEEKENPRQSVFEAYSAYNGWATGSRTATEDKQESAQVTIVEESIREETSDASSIKEKDIKAVIRAASIRSVRSIKSTRSTATGIAPPVQLNATLPSPTAEEPTKEPATPTDTPDLAATYIPSDPKRASTISVISLVIAPSAAAAALARHSPSYTPYSRPSSPSKRFSTSLSRASSVRSVPRQSIDTIRSPTRPSVDLAPPSRPFSRLSAQYVPSESSDASDSDSDYEVPVTSLSPAVTTAPSVTPAVEQLLTPLQADLIPSLDVLLAKTSILSQYPLWEKAMGLKREAKAFLSVGVEEVADDEVKVAAAVKSMIERGEEVRILGKREREKGKKARGDVGRVRSFWMEKDSGAVII